MSTVKKVFYIRRCPPNSIDAIFRTEAEAMKCLLDHAVEGTSYGIEPRYFVSDRASAPNTHLASIVMPIWQCPQRTMRAIKSVLNQDINGWQLLCIGDGCSNWSEVLKSKWFITQQLEAYCKGNEIIGINTEHFGSYGYHQRELAKWMSSGIWTLYLDNDDYILPNHISSRVFQSDNKDLSAPYDFMYFNTQKPNHLWRDAQLFFGQIGNAEIMFRTDFLKTLSPIRPEYGHDWIQIEEAISKTTNHGKGTGDLTYVIRSLPDCKEQGID